MGGTFDPPHIAHLLAGESAYRDLDLDIVHFIPAGAPWQKAGQPVTDADHRLAMTELATSGVEYFVADDREVTREGWSYTADTLAEFDDEDELFLIVGTDTAARMLTWDRIDEVLRQSQIAVAPRLGTDRSDVEATEIPFIWLDMPVVAISATDVRDRAESGKSYRFLVRPNVYRYIESNRLYNHP